MLRAGAPHRHSFDLMSQVALGEVENILFLYCPWCKEEFSYSDTHCSKCGNRRGSSKPAWRKILWEKQPYEDNYVDETFLASLKRNANFSGYTVVEVLRASTVVVQQISTVSLFILVFAFTMDGTLPLPLLLALAVFLVVFGFLVRMFTDVTFGARNIFKSGRTLFLLYATVFSLSPVLRTLTNSFSDDTITSCTALLLLLHLFFHDYGYVNGDAKKFSAPVSLNAAIFASVLLASRVPSNLHVFGLISIAIELFALFPIIRHYLRRYSLLYHYTLTTLLSLLTLILFAFMSLPAAIIYSITVLFITVACPFWLVFIQKYKNEINGPWDEAVPQRM